MQMPPAAAALQSVGASGLRVWQSKSAKHCSLVLPGATQ